jgi:hypothetical protein
MLRNKASLFFLAIALLALAQVALATSEVLYDSGNRRDPFVPLDEGNGISAVTTSSGVKLEGIIYDPGGRSMAIFNGKSYQMGETLGDATVVKISKDYVVISIRKEEKTLWIREEEKT